MTAVTCIYHKLCFAFVPAAVVSGGNGGVNKRGCWKCLYLTLYVCQMCVWIHWDLLVAEWLLFFSYFLRSFKSYCSKPLKKERKCQFRSEGSYFIYIYIYIYIFADVNKQLCHGLMEYFPQRVNELLSILSERLTGKQNVKQ